jgi:hypothetical protein
MFGRSGDDMRWRRRRIRKRARQERKLLAYWDTAEKRIAEIEKLARRLTRLEIVAELRQPGHTTFVVDTGG